MHHSFSSQSFLKPSQIQRTQHPQKYIHNDITVPRDYFNQRECQDEMSDDSPQKSNISTHSISKLRKKISQIKSALKIAQQHNQDLHKKLNQQKKYFLDQKKFYQNEVNKYKGLYEMLIENYETRLLELKDAKKKIKKMEKNNMKNNSEIACNNCQRNKHLSPEKLQKDQNDSRSRVKEIIEQQQVSLDHLKHENKLLREEIILKNKKLSQYEILLQTYQSEQRISKLSPKNSKQLIELKTKVQSFEQERIKLKKDREFAQLKIKRLEVELQSSKNFNQTIQKEDSNLKKQNQQLRVELMIKEKLFSQKKNDNPEQKWKMLYEQMTKKYNQLLRFSYQIQKDFERELHTMAKQMTRREIVKNVQNS